MKNAIQSILLSSIVATAAVPLPAPPDAGSAIAITEVDGQQIRDEEERPRAPLPLVGRLISVRGEAYTGSRSWTGVQLLERSGEGAWRAASAPADPVPVAGPAPAFTWALPEARLRAGGGNHPVEIMACLVSSQPLPVGALLTPLLWRRITAMSPTLAVLPEAPPGTDCRTWIERVGTSAAVRDVPIPVGRTEEIIVRCAQLPRGAVVQLIVRPDGQSRVWVMPQYGEPRDGVWCGTAYFGRRGLVTSGDSQWRELDLSSRFRLMSVVLQRPLAPRNHESLTPAEWNALAPNILAASPWIETVRAIESNGLRVRVSRIDGASSGTRWLAFPVGRVEGELEAGPEYAPLDREWISLLRRKRDESVWTVAGHAKLMMNHAHWTIAAADLGEPGEEYVGMATVGYQPFDGRQPVTAELLEARAVSISEVVRYRVVQVDKRPSKGVSHD